MRKPKGTYDVIPSTVKKWQYVENVLRSVCLYYNIKEIRTPIFESSELFHRGVGETTDIVSKETYMFNDRGNRSMTLRPEGTAGTARAFVENKLYVNTPQKVFYYGPMFRYERPQAGRFRQFMQFGVEVFGEDEPAADAEVIAVAYHIYELLGLEQLVVKVNTLGDMESRDNYRQALLDYLEPQRESLCKDCQNRIDKNPLRVLDCKVDEFTNPPRMSDYRSSAAQEYFEKVLDYLNGMGIPYEVDDTLVRGLDYYNHTVFEVQATIQGFGSQNTLCGGGRYNGLVEEIGGPDIPGIGFALGMERTIDALEKEGLIPDKEDFINCFVAYMPETKIEAIRLVDGLRLNGFVTEMSNVTKSLKAQLKSANKQNAEVILVLGTDEVERGVVQVKYQGNAEEVELENIIHYIDGLELGDVSE